MTCYYQVPNGDYALTVTGEGTGGFDCNNGSTQLVGVGDTFSCSSGLFVINTINTSTITTNSPIATYTQTGTSGTCDLIFTFDSGDSSAALEITMHGWCYPSTVDVSISGGIADGVTATLTQINQYPPEWVAGGVPDPGSPANNPLPSITYTYNSEIYVQGQGAASDTFNSPVSGIPGCGTQVWSDTEGNDATLTPGGGGGGGDPHFVGFDGVCFDYHGVPGNDYLIWLDNENRIVARFDSPGELCPAWSNNTFMTKITINGQEIVADNLMPSNEEEVKDLTGMARGLPRQINFIAGDVTGIRIFPISIGEVVVTSMKIDRFTHLNMVVRCHLSHHVASGILGQTLLPSHKRLPNDTFNLSL